MSQQLTPYQLKQLQEIQAAEREISVLDREIGTIDREINSLEFLLHDLDAQKAQTDELIETANWKIKTECNPLKRANKRADCRAKHVSLITAYEARLLGLEDSKILYLGKKSNKQLRKNTKIAARAHKKRAVADSIRILAEQGIDARSNLVGSVFGGMSNLTNSVGSAISGGTGTNVATYTAPQPTGIIPQAVDLFTPTETYNPITGEMEEDNTHLFMWGGLTLFAGLVGLIVYKKIKK